jgi:2-keto-3-deoxy-L-rhamnonate aldolase RhmA
MPEPPTLRERIRRSETLLGMFLNLGSTTATELCARAGYDWLVIDLEHGVATEADLLGHLHAAGGTSTTPIVRVEEGTRLRIGRALDLGAPGIMVPRVDTVEHAREVAGYLRYPPDGVRGVALGTRGTGYGRVGHDDVGLVNERVVGVFQVESRAAVDSADAIAAIDGVDVLFVGPSDLSHALGIPGRVDDQRFTDAISHVGRAAAEHGKAAGVLLWSFDDVERWTGLGYRFLALGSDAMAVANAARSTMAVLRERVASLSPPAVRSRPGRS